MITKQHIGMVLAKCSGYRPDKTPQPNDVVLMAWLEHFEQFPHLTSEDVLDAVKVYHREPNDRMIQPADISKLARGIHQDRLERQPALEEPDDEKAAARAEAINMWARGFVPLPSGPQERSPAYTESGAIDMECPQCEAKAGDRCINPVTGEPARMPCLARMVDGFEPRGRKQLGRGAKLAEVEARRLARRITKAAK